MILLNINAASETNLLSQAPYFSVKPLFITVYQAVNMQLNRVFCGSLQLLNVQREGWGVRRSSDAHFIRTLRCLRLWHQALCDSTQHINTQLADGCREVAGNHGQQRSTRQNEGGKQREGEEGGVKRSDRKNAEGGGEEGGGCGWVINLIYHWERETQGVRAAGESEHDAVLHISITADTK